MSYISKRSRKQDVYDEALQFTGPSYPPILPHSKAGTVLMAKDDDDGQTILMLAAATGNVDVFELVVSQLPREQVGKVDPKPVLFGCLGKAAFSPWHVPYNGRVCLEQG